MYNARWHPLKGRCDNGSHTTSDTSSMSVASSSDLSCGQCKVYHISWLFSMWLWLISDPRCCLVHRPEARSQEISVTCKLPHYLCYNSTLVHVTAPKYLTRAPYTQAGCVLFCRSNGVNRISLTDWYTHQECVPQYRSSSLNHFFLSLSFFLKFFVCLFFVLFWLFLFCFVLPWTGSAEVWFPVVMVGQRQCG